MTLLRKLALAALCLTVWIAGPKPCAKAQDAEQTLQELIGVAEDKANTYAAIVDKATFDVAKNRLLEVNRRYQNAMNKMSGILVPPDEGQRLTDKYRTSLVSAHEKVLKEMERIDAKGIASLKSEADKIRDDVGMYQVAPSIVNVIIVSSDSSDSSGSSRSEGGGFLLSLLLIVILFACVACLYTEGTWGNLLRLINVVTAALLATNFFEPTADMFEGWFPSFTYVWDFLALWGLFGCFMIVFRLITDRLSKVKVRLLSIADRIGSAVLAAWIGWVMVCFSLMTLHTAPLARECFWGSFQTETVEQNLFIFGLAPDRQWLAFVQKMSMGGFSRQQENVFDASAKFIPKYATRRENLDEQMKATESLRTLAP